MTKSTPSTSTTTSTNPVATAQQPYLSDLWSSAKGMVTDPGVQGFVNNIAAYGQNAGNAAIPGSQAIVPAATNFANAALGGTLPQSSLPAGSQISNLTRIGDAAGSAGSQYGQQISDASNAGFGNLSPYTSGLQSIAGQYAPLVGTGYQLGGALQGLGQGSLGAGQQALGQFGGLSGQAQSVANPAESQLMQNAGMGISGNPIYDSLQGMASGQYVDPNRNPAMQGLLKAATDPLVSQYQTATAPGISSAMEASGRYGSGAQTNAVGQAQQALARGLGSATSGIVNNAYNTGLQAQLGAGQALGSAYNTGMSNANQALSSAGGLGQSGLSLAGSLLGQGYGNLQTGYGTAGNLTNQAGSTIGNLANIGLGGAASALTAGGGLQNTGQQTLQSGLASAANATNTGYGTAAGAYGAGANAANAGTLDLGSIAQMAPSLANFPSQQYAAGMNALWSPYQNFASLLGSPAGGSGTQSTTTPYYSNTLSQIGSGLTGAASLAKLFMA